LGTQGKELDFGLPFHLETIIWDFYLRKALFLLKLRKDWLELRIKVGLIKEGEEENSFL